MSAFFYALILDRLRLSMDFLYADYRNAIDLLTGFVSIVPIYLRLTTAFVPPSLETASESSRLCSFYSENSRDRVNLHAKIFSNRKETFLFDLYAVKKFSKHDKNCRVWVLKLFQSRKKPASFRFMLCKKQKEEQNDVIQSSKDFI